MSTVRGLFVTQTTYEACLHRIETYESITPVEMSARTHTKLREAGMTDLLPMSYFNYVGSTAFHAKFVSTGTCPPCLLAEEEDRVQSNMDA